MFLCNSRFFSFIKKLVLFLSILIWYLNMFEDQGKGAVYSIYKLINLSA